MKKLIKQIVNWFNGDTKKEVVVEKTPLDKKREEVRTQFSGLNGDPRGEELLEGISKGVLVHKRLEEREQLRIDLWNDEQLYNALVELIKKYFKDQNEDLKKRVRELEPENKKLRLENTKLKKEVASLKVLVNNNAYAE